MCCNPTVYFKIRVVKINLCCNSMISQPLPNYNTKFSQKERVGSYDNIALNQRYPVYLRFATVGVWTLAFLPEVGSSH